VAEFIVHSQFETPDFQLRFPAGAFPQGFPAFLHPKGAIVSAGATPDGSPAAIVETRHHDAEVLDALTRLADGTIDDRDVTRLRESCHRIRLAHRAAAQDVVGVLRWMTHRPGGRAGVGRRQQTLWLGEDGVPRPFPGLGAPPYLDAQWGVFEFGDDRRQWIQRAITDGEREPLAHVLWREARELVSTAPSSAVLIGATSLEVGVKQHIGRMGGTTRKGRGSPGALELLARGVPMLDPSRWVQLPRWLNRRLGAGVAARNRIVHEGAEPPDTQTVVWFLRAVRDVLLLLDFQSGREWATSYIDFPHGEGVQLVGPEPVLEAPSPFD
jgi:hypothetical protein